MRHMTHHCIAARASLGLLLLCGGCSAATSSTTLRSEIKSAVDQGRPNATLAKSLAEYCVRRAEEDEASAATRSGLDTTMIVLASVAGTTGAVTAGISGATKETSDSRPALTQTSAATVALAAGVLGLRTALNLNEQVVARREAAARRKRAAAMIAANTSLADNVHAFADCIQEDVLVARTGPTAPVVMQTARSVGEIEGQIIALKENIASAERKVAEQQQAASKLQAVAALADKSVPTDLPRAIVALREGLDAEGKAQDAIIATTVTQLEKAELQVRLLKKEEESLLSVTKLAREVGASGDAKETKQKALATAALIAEAEAQAATRRTAIETARKAREQAIQKRVEDAQKRVTELEASGGAKGTKTSEPLLAEFRKELQVSLAASKVAEAAASTAVLRLSEEERAAKEAAKASTAEAARRSDAAGSASSVPSGSPGPKKE